MNNKTIFTSFLEEILENVHDFYFNFFHIILTRKRIWLKAYTLIVLAKRFHLLIVTNYETFLFRQVKLQKMENWKFYLKWDYYFNCTMLWEVVMRNVLFSLNGPYPAVIRFHMGVVWNPWDASLCYSCQINFSFS